MSMQISHQHKTLIIKILGELDLVIASQFRQRVDDAWEEWPVLNMILDLSQVTFIDSSGLGVILGRYKKVKERKGEFILVGFNPQIGKILEMSGIMSIIRVNDNIEDAFKALEIDKLVRRKEA